MKVIPSLAALLTLGLMLPPALAQDKPTREVAASTHPGQGTAVEIVRASVVIESVDPDKRHVTIKDAHGKLTSLAYGPDVRNLDQLKPGDKVHVRYAQALTLSLMKNGKELRSNVQTATGDRAPAGQLPGGNVGQQTEITADVVAVDRKSQVIMLRGPQHTLDLKIGDPEQLKLIHTGDQVHAVYTEAVALAVEPAGK